MTTPELLDQGSYDDRRQSVSGFVGWDGGFDEDARKAAVRRCYGTFVCLELRAAETLSYWSSVDAAGGCRVGTCREGGRQCRGVVESRDRVGPRTDRD